MGGRLGAQSWDQRGVRFNVENLGETKTEIVVKLTGLMGADMDDAARGDPVPL
jgi:hypothetical protein